MSKNDDIIYKLCQVMVSKPHLFELKKINDSTYIISYKDFFIAKIDEEMSLNYKGKDIETTDIQRCQLSDAYRSVMDWQIEFLTKEIDKLLL